MDQTAPPFRPTEERICFLEQQRALLLVEIDNLRRSDPLQNTHTIGQVHHLQQEYNAAIDEETRVSSGALMDPLEALPPELWRSFLPDDLDGILTLTMVSLKWSQSLRSMPELWSTVTLDATKEDYLAKAAICLSLSQSMEIDLRIKNPLWLWRRDALMMLEHSGRIRTLSIHFDAPWRLEESIHILRTFQELPALKYLHLPLHDHDVSLTIGGDHHFNLMDSSGSSLVVHVFQHMCLLEAKNLSFTVQVLQQPGFVNLESVKIRSLDEETMSALNELSSLKYLHLADREEYGQETWAPSDTTPPLSSIRHFQCDSLALTRALKYTGVKLVTITARLGVDDFIELVKSLYHFKVLYELSLEIRRDGGIEKPEVPSSDEYPIDSSPVRRLSLVFLGLTLVGAGGTEQHMKDDIDRRDAIFSSIFIYLSRVIPFVETVDFAGEFLVDLSLECIESLRNLRSLTFSPRMPSMWAFTDYYQHVGCLPYAPPVQFLDCLRNHSLEHLDIRNNAPRSFLQLLPGKYTDEFDFLPFRHSIAPAIPSISSLILRIERPLLCDLPFPNLRIISLLGRSSSATWASDFFEELIVQPDLWPSLEHIVVKGDYMEWDILILMLGRRNFLARSGVKHIKSLGFDAWLPYTLLCLVTQLLKGRFVEGPPLLELSIEEVGKRLQDPKRTGCERCIRMLRTCESPILSLAAGQGNHSRERLKSDLYLKWSYQLPSERLLADPPLFSEVVQWLEGKQDRRLKFARSREAAKQKFLRMSHCAEFDKENTRTVGSYSMDGVNFED